MEAKTERRMGTSMTDKERRKLCDALRSYPEDAVEIIAWMRMAANEIERLAALAQSNAEPVAWQYRIKQGGWGGWYEAAPTKEEALACINAQIKLNFVDEYELRPLYAAPPRSNRSKSDA